MNNKASTIISIAVDLLDLVDEDYSDSTKEVLNNAAVELLKEAAQIVNLGVLENSKLGSVTYRDLIQPFDSVSYPLTLTHSIMTHQCEMHGLELTGCNSEIANEALRDAQICYDHARDSLSEDEALESAAVTYHGVIQRYAEHAEKHKEKQDKDTVLTHEMLREQCRIMGHDIEYVSIDSQAEYDNALKEAQEVYNAIISSTRDKQSAMNAASWQYYYALY